MKIEITYTYSAEDIEAAVLESQRNKHGAPPSGFVWSYRKPSYSDEAEVTAKPLNTKPEETE